MTGSGGIFVGQDFFYKKPKCANFGVPETPFRGKLATGAAPPPGDYNLAAASKGLPPLQRLLCRETMPMRSNQAVHEELARVMGYLVPLSGPSYQTNLCSRLNVPLSAAGATSVQRGKPAAGTPRYRCNACKNAFSGVGQGADTSRRCSVLPGRWRPTARNASPKEKAASPKENAVSNQSPVCGVRPVRLPYPR